MEWKGRVSQIVQRWPEKSRKQTAKEDSNHSKSWLWEQIGVYSQCLASLYTYLRHETQLWCPGVCSPWFSVADPGHRLQYSQCPAHSPQPGLCEVCPSSWDFSPSCPEIYSTFVSAGEAKTLLCPWSTLESTLELWQALYHTSNLGQNGCFPCVLALWVGFTAADITAARLTRLSTCILFNATEIAQ